MRVLICGASGFLGSRVAARLLKDGHRVYGLIRPQQDRSGRSELPGQLDLVSMDLTSLETTHLPEVDALMLLAQSRHHRDFPSGAQDMFQVNVAAPLALMEWARVSGVRSVVLGSSGGVYARHGWMTDRGSRPNATGALGFYLATKASAELLFESYATFFPSAVLLRPFFMFGPGQRADMLIPRLIHSVKGGRPVQLHGDEGMRTNPIFVDDAAAAFVGALTLDGQRAFDIAGEEVMTLRQLVRVIGRFVGRAPAFEHVPGHPMDLVADTSAMHAALGPPRTSFEDGLSRTVAALRG